MVYYIYQESKILIFNLYEIQKIYEALLPDNFLGLTQILYGNFVFIKWTNIIFIIYNGNVHFYYS